MGGMASVHECIDHRLDRRVAIKILHPHVSESEDARKRLAREARAIAQLKHESVIEVYDYAIDDPDCTWLITELIEGQSLREALDRSARPLPEVAVMIVFEIVRALQAAHSVGIVHRDVKPDNVLIGANGRPKLSDFGIAQVLHEDRMTLTGNLVGSPSYMSPEQAEGRRTDHRTDLFSAGVVLYRMVTGVLPFPGQNAIETLRKVAAVEYLDPTEIEPKCPATIAGIIRKAMAPRIDDRYQDSQDMLADLTAILEDCGLASTWQELPRYFEDNEHYQHELSGRLAKTLSARGQILMDAGDESRALDCFNRAMTLGSNNEQTYDLVKVLSKRRERGRWRRVAWAASVAMGAVVLISGALVATEAFDGRRITGAAIGVQKLDVVAAPDTAPGADRPTKAMNAGAVEATPNKADVKAGGAAPVKTDAPAKANAPTKVADAPAKSAASANTARASNTGADRARKAAADRAHEAAADRAHEAAADRARKASADRAREAARRAAARASDTARQTEKTASTSAKSTSQRTSGTSSNERGTTGDRTSDAAAAAKVAPKPAPKPRGTLQIGTSRWVDVYVDGVRLGRAPDRSRYRLPPGKHRVKAVNPHCNPMEKVVKIDADQTTRVRLKLVCP